MRAHIFYSGHVQGVGFSFVVQRLALDLGLKGWVKNLVDGRVEVMLEGEKPVVEQCCIQIENHFQGNIRHKDSHFESSNGIFQDFQIHY